MATTDEITNNLINYDDTKMLYDDTPINSDLHNLLYETIPHMETIDIIALDWDTISSSKELKIDDVVKNLQYPWRWVILSKTIPIEDIITYHNNLPWNIRGVNMRHDITIDILKKYTRLPLWEWHILSGRISFEDINSNLNLPWNHFNFSKRRDLTIDIVKQYPELPIDWVCYTNRASLDTIKANEEIPWDPYMISFKKANRSNVKLCVPLYVIMILTCILITVLVLCDIL